MRTMLKGKIHRARVTDANVNYEGSITIDRKLMELEAKEREIAQLQEDEAAARTPASAEDAVDTAFPMVGGAPSPNPLDSPPVNPGPGWDATKRFFPQ